MNNININDLKRKKIRKVIEFEGCEIEIYNPDKKEQSKIISILLEKYDRTRDQIIVDDIELLTIMIPIFSNIYIDNEDQELIKEILNDPSEVMLMVVDEIQEILVEIINRLQKTLNTINQMETEEIQNLFNEDMVNNISSVYEKMS